MNTSQENKTQPSGNPTVPTQTPQLPRQSDRSPLGRRALIYLVSLAAAFLLGFTPMWFKAASRAKERDAAQRELRLAQIQLTLASAAIDARRAEYEAARLAAVKFFTTLTAEMDRANGSAVSPAQRDALQPLFEQRDDLITLLARSDPASAELLAKQYVAFRKAIGR